MRDQLTNAIDFLKSEIEDIDVNVEQMRLVMSALEAIEVRHPRQPETLPVMNAEDIRDFLRIKREERSPSLEGSWFADDVNPVGTPYPPSHPHRSLTDVSSTGIHGPAEGLATHHSISTSDGSQDRLTDVSSTGLTPTPEDGRLPVSKAAPILSAPAFPSSPRILPSRPPRAQLPLHSAATTLTDSSSSSPVVASMPYPQPVTSSSTRRATSRPFRPRTGPPSKIRTRQGPVVISQASTALLPKPSTSKNSRRHTTRSVREPPPSASSSQPSIVNRAFVQIPPFRFSAPAGFGRTTASASSFVARDVIDLTVPPPVIDLCSPGSTPSPLANEAYISSPLSSVPEVLN